MNRLESYRTEMDLGAGDPIVIEYKKPNSYRSLVIANDNQTGLRTLGELLYVGDTIYAHKCNADGTDCKAWDRTPRGEVIVGAASPSYFPQWPIVALEMAHDVSASTETGRVLVRGSVNHIRAVFENSRRLAKTAGITPTYGQECSAASTPVERTTPPDDPSTPGSSSAQNCRDLTYEESLASQEPGLSFYDNNPATIEAEIDPVTHLLTRFKMTFAVPGDNGELTGEERTLTFTYSKFNGVTIEAPQ
jgi:hypothetical protein